METRCPASWSLQPSGAVTLNAVPQVEVSPSRNTEGLENMTVDLIYVGCGKVTFGQSPEYQWTRVGRGPSAVDLRSTVPSFQVTDRNGAREPRDQRTGTGKGLAAPLQDLQERMLRARRAGRDVGRSWEVSWARSAW